VLATVLSAAVRGLDGIPLSVEVDLQRGLRAFHIVGLPSPAVRESRERVVSALLNCGFQVPERRVTVNLAPADLPKEGAAFDLSIALGILAASGQYAGEGLAGVCVLGELALDGTLRPARGVLPIAIAMRRRGVQRILVPRDNVAEAELVPGLDVVGCATLAEAAQCTGRLPRAHKPLTPAPVPSPAPAAATTDSLPSPATLDFSRIDGQEIAKRALVVAAAGGHHIFLAGPPGVGKSLLARCLPELLPPLSEDEALEVRQVLSVCGQHEAAAAPTVTRPFRAPHHTITVPALVGGGRPVVPGEITRAQHGVLFLDELPEFPRRLLDLLRQPLEEGVIRLARANQAIAFPARFQLVAAMNSCPCGNWGHPKKPCRCSPGDVERYQSRISGPILDRIDLRIEVGVPPAEKVGGVSGEGAAESARLRARVAAARARQVERYAHFAGVHCNAQVTPELRRTFIRPRREALQFLRQAMTRWSLSIRAFDRALAVARTIADLEGASDIDVQHVAEALQYRVQRVEIT